MSRKDDSVYFGHMLDACRKISGRTASLSRAEYDGDEFLRLALVHLVQVIGEAARRVSEAGRAANPGIPWREITGMRHKIVHDYMDVSQDVLWEVVSKDIPPLEEQLARVAPPEAPDGE